VSPVQVTVDVEFVAPDRDPDLEWFVHRCDLIATV
jgi:hypothetical protein